MAIRSLIVLLILAATGIGARVVASPPVFTIPTPGFDSLPRQINGWTSEDIPMTENVARVLDADETLTRVYTDGQGKFVTLFLAYFATQQVNSQIHSPRNCVPGSGWKVLSTSEVAENLIGRPHGATRMVIARNESRHQMLYWFRTRGGDLTDEYGLKWDLIKNAIARQPTNATFIRFVAPIDQEAAMKDVMGQLSGPIEEALQRAQL